MVRPSLYPVYGEGRGCLSLHLLKGKGVRGKAQQERKQENVWEHAATESTDGKVLHSHLSMQDSLPSFHFGASVDVRTGVCFTASQ